MKIYRDISQKNIHGGGTTLTPGVYDSSDGTFQITGTLTLDAQGDPEGVFIFKTASTLITASDSNINLTNSARFCRTFWKVGSSATLGTNSRFVGHIFAMESITANNGATIQGQLLARTGAVTLDNNIITNGICEVLSIQDSINEEGYQEIPKSGYFPTEILFGIGVLLTGTGLLVKKKKSNAKRN
ncbi:MAG: ice-binding family protein [Mobilitalea sp.]